MDKEFLTVKEIRDLLRERQLEPQDVFDADTLNLWREGQAYAEQALAKARAEEKEPDDATAPKDANGDSAEPDPNDKYIDPAKNPLIRTE